MIEIDQMWAELQEKLSSLNTEENLIKRLELSRRAAANALLRLENFEASCKEFTEDPDILIDFNRLHAPRFYAKFIFFSKVLTFECLKADAEPSEYGKVLEMELAGIKRFLGNHKEFRNYYLKGREDHDYLYFHYIHNGNISFEELIVGISPHVNQGCLLVAYMIALDDYHSYLTTPEKSEPAIDPDLQWDGLVSDLNEVAIALEGYINKGNRPATLAEIRHAFGNLLHVSLANGGQIDNNRRNNQSDGPNFLEKLAEKMIRRKTNLADNQKSRKRRG
jgi:hypothetical protein